MCLDAKEFTMSRQRSTTFSKALKALQNANDHSPAGELRRRFPDELEKIFKLHPLRSLAHADEFAVDFANIIFFNQKLVDDGIKQTIMLATRSADEAAEKIEIFKKNFGALDTELLKPIFRLMQQLYPELIPKNIGNDELFKVLSWIQIVFLFLSLATAISTSVGEPPKRRGRPESQHIFPVIQLIQLWERTTTKKLGKLKPVPTPKRNQGLIDQPSTEFIRIALKMIDPEINEAKTFTAIKHALEAQEEFYRLLPSDSDMARTLGAMFAMDERATLVRKMR
jgi:hypothetical protein